MRHTKKFFYAFAILLLVTAIGIALFMRAEDLSSVRAEVRIEVGDNIPPADMFLENEDHPEITSFSIDPAFSPEIPGVYTVELVCLGFTRNSLLIVEDTNKPEVSVRDLTVYNPDTYPDPMDYIDSIQDVTDVTVSYQTVPDLSISGKQNVEILVSDIAGNVTQVTGILTIVHDTAAPVITGVKNLEVYAGDTLSYRNDITVTDDQDPNPILEIDSSTVDLTTPGNYTVTYSSTDHAGNISTATASVTVHPKRENHVDPAVIYAAADDKLAQFITDDMTVREQVEAVYCWVNIHMQYAGNTDKTDWLQAGYESLMTLRGDCYAYFALNKLFLSRLGIPTIDVEKVKNYQTDSNHYWLMVSIDGGESYYHMDNIWSLNLCLVTDAELDNFSRQYNNCFNRDMSLYPPTPENPLPDSTLPWYNESILNS